LDSVKISWLASTPASNWFAEFPRHAPFHQDYRRALLRKFPYAVFYTYDEEKDTVKVYCIFHTSRDPKKLIERLSGY